MDALDRLLAALERLDAAWRAADAPIVPYLAPGLPPDAVREALVGIGLEAPAELLVWFGWHDGTAGNRGKGQETWSIAPTVFLQSLAECLQLHAMAETITANLSQAGVDPRLLLPPSCLPITRHLGPYLDVVSCDSRSPGATWFVAWDSPAQPNGPHLADLVERLASRWEEGIDAWADGRWRELDEAELKIGPNVPW